MIAVFICFFAGLALNMLCRGCETGFFRVTRVRLVVDSLSGSWISRGLLYLVNNPSLYVATALLGNNCAQYLISFSLLLSTKEWFGGASQQVELVAPLILTPALFVYGDLLPKSLFYHAPNRMLSIFGWPFLVLTVLAAPVLVILWAIFQLLQRILGDSPVRTRLSLARKELQDVLTQGQEAGILQPSQRLLAQNLFAIAAQPISQHCLPVTRTAYVRLGQTRDDALYAARRHQSPTIIVLDTATRRPAGYVHAVDLYLQDQEKVTRVLPMPSIKPSRSVLDTVIQMQTDRAEMACVEDEQSGVVGFVQLAGLLKPLLKSRS